MEVLRLNLFKTGEDLLRRYVERNIYGVLRPLFFIQLILGGCRFRLTDSGPVQPKKLCKIHTGVIVTAFLSLFVFLSGFIENFFGLFIFDLYEILVYLSLILKAYRGNFVNAFKELVDVHLCLNVTFKSFSYWYIINCSFAALQVMHAIVKEFGLILFLGPPETTMLTLIILEHLFLSLNRIGMCVALNVFSMNLQLLHNFVNSLESERAADGSKVGRNVDIREDADTMCEHYDRIMKAYHIFKRTFQFEILANVVEIFLSIVDVALLSSHNSFITVTRATPIIATAIPNIVLYGWMLVHMCVVANRIKSENRRLESILLEDTHSSVRAVRRRSAKRLLKLVRHTPRHFFLYGMFELDISFLLRLLVVSLTYTLVTLQFFSLNN